MHISVLLKHSSEGCLKFKMQFKKLTESKSTETFLTKQKLLNLIKMSN